MNADQFLFRAQALENGAGQGARGALDMLTFGLDLEDVIYGAKPDVSGGGKGGGGGGGGGGKGGGKPSDGGGTGDGGTGDGGTGGGVLTTYISGGDAATSYNVEIDFGGSWTVELQQAFIDAAEYLSAIILGDVTDIIGGGSQIDDIVITANLVEIDGPNGILGRAGPTTVRGGTGLPATGIMEFDIADAQVFYDKGLWDAIVLHEMIHAIGFGTMWSYMGLTTGSVSAGDLRFTGELATYYYNTEFPTIAGADAGSGIGVPVETDGGSGTAGGHWDELIFDNEIMTGYIDGSNYLSLMSIAVLEDMGYDTVLDNPFSGTDLSGPIPPDFFA